MKNLYLGRVESSSVWGNEEHNELASDYGHDRPPASTPSILDAGLLIVEKGRWPGVVTLCSLLCSWVPFLAVYI